MQSWVFEEDGQDEDLCQKFLASDFSVVNLLAMILNNSEFLKNLFMLPTYFIQNDTVETILRKSFIECPLQK